MKEAPILTIEQLESDAPLLGRAWRQARIGDGTALNQALFGYAPEVKRALARGQETHVICHPHAGETYPRLAGLRFYVEAGAGR